ncbi:pesticidal protein [Bacillus thuringiensis]|uniref:Pesticidal protein n=1 Tax=Bacillus thuringiensis serovar toumanoffi TaxID=180862 RepID=A0ABD5I8H3_BACTU|nr:hypothetical protein [Bacillus thuringiensis]MCU5280566.1 pesticidal protein [Bacillus cereus]AMR88603.1 pesticidal protein [Bacillus thuringiensis]EEM93056.1 Pesticidal crystal protein cry1Ae [Bacillus thuringiensis IBL 200]MBG9640704.1 pesticidal protein [Bacillus thuringiensis]MBG9677055.1 pesticidal protein [Bacillus thuringiensis]
MNDYSGATSLFLLSAGYITKELEYFPETDKVWIEIGEMEGTFIVDSVELLLMEE